MKKLTALICVIAVLCTMALISCSVEQAAPSDPAPSQTLPTSIDDLDDTGFECIEKDATELTEQQTTTDTQTETTQPETTQSQAEQPTEPETTRAPETTKKSTSTTKKPTTTEKQTTVKKPAATKKPTTETTLAETTTTKKMAIPTVAETTKKSTTTTKKATTTTKKTTTTKGDSDTTIKKTTTTKKSTTTTQKATNPTYSYTSGQKHTALHYTKRYHYNLLDKPLQEVYDLIVKAANNLDAKTEDFVLDDKYEDSFRDAFLAFHYDNPEYFYIARYYGVVNYGNNKHCFEFLYSVANYDEDPTGSNQLFSGEVSESLKSRIRAKKATFDKEVSKILSTIPANAPDVVKEKMVYETILKTRRYNMTAVTEYLWDGRCDDNWTSYGIMVNKAGVCESYSEAFQTLCLQMGINAITITGSVSSGGHMWNAVELDDGWYMCDITFDDPIGAGAGTARFHYFNRTSQWMQENSNHNWFMSDFKVPKCTKTQYSYTNYFGADDR